MKKFTFIFKEKHGKSIIDAVIPLGADLEDFARRRDEAVTELKHRKSGAARARDLRNATERFNQERKRKAARKHEQWCRAARQVWAEDSGWSASWVAKKIARPDENPDYIRQIIATENPSKKS